MILTQEQIEKLSKRLSKVQINNPKIQENMNNILASMELLGEIDTTWVEPTVSVASKKNILREDREDSNKISREALLKCSNQKIIQHQIAVSSIM